MLKQLFIVASIILFNQSFAQSSILIQDAVDKKMITYNISGSWNRYDKQDFLDADGQYYGKCMTLNIKSKVDSIVYLYITNGLMLICSDTVTQDMIITKPIYVSLQPRESKTVQLYAMCSEIHDAMPHKQTAYSVGTMADENLVSITQSIDHLFMHNIVGQGAVWAYTDSATEEDLRRYGATDHSLDMTIQVLNTAGVTTHLNAPNTITTEADSVFEITDNYTPPPHTHNLVSVNAYALYFGCGLILILFSTTVYLLVRNRKNNSDKNVTT